LDLYKCDKKSLALSLTLDKFDKIVSSEHRVNFAIYLCATAIVLNFDINSIGCEEIINSLETRIRGYFNTLIV
jgi:hypothetical protein